MAGEIATAFVRIRPDLSGFRAETQTGVKSAFSSLGKIVGGAIAVGGVADLVKNVAEAATAHQAAFDVLDRTIKNSGASLRVFGSDIETVLEKEARLKGFTDEDLSSSLVRLVSATGNTKKAFHDLGLAEDLARARHIDVATAALALSKAEQGNYTSLQRYGIIVKSAAVETDKLKQAHDRAVASGATFTAQQKQEYQAALQVAAAADKQAKAQAAIALVQQRFGGAAGTFANTAAGQFARLSQDFHQLEVQAGTTLLPALAGGAEGLGHLINRLRETGDVQKVFAAGTATIVGGLHDLEGVAQTVGPPLLTIATAGAKVVETLGATPILVGVAAYKSLGIVVLGAAKAQGAYIAVSALGAKTDTTNATAKFGLTAATTATTAATTRQTVASTAAAAAAVEEAAGIRAVAVSASGLLIPIGAAVTETEALAAAEQAVAITSSEAAVGGLANFARGLAPLAAGALTSPAAIAIGVAALAGGIAYLATRESQWASANKELTGSLQGLIQAQQQEAQAQGALARAAGQQNIAKEAAKEADALNKLATQSLQRAGPTVLGNFTVSSSAPLDMLQKIAARQGKLAELNAVGAKTFIDAVGQQILALGKQNPLLAHNLDLVGELAKAYHRIPTQAEIKLLLNNKDPKAGLVELITPLGQIIDLFKQLGKTIKDATSPSNSGVYPGILKAIQAAAAAEPMIQAQQDKVVAGLQKNLAALTATGDAALAQQREDLAQQEQQGRESILSAIASAQQNTIGIGASIASSIAAVIDKPLQTAQDSITLAQDKIAATFDKAGAPYVKQAALIQSSQDLIAAKYDRLSAQLIPEVNRLNSQNARAQLASDKLSLSNLRRGVLLPGGKELATDPTKALAQLHALANAAGTTSKATVDAFIIQYSAAFRAVESDQVGLKQTAISNARTVKETGLGLASDRNRVATDALARSQAAKLAPLQARSDTLKVAQDQANLVKAAITQRIADLTTAFTEGKIKFATLSGDLAGILIKHDAGFKKAGRLLGSAFRAQFEAQFQGLELQAGALNAAPAHPGLGLLPQIVKPEETIRATLLQNHRAESAISKAQLDQQKKQNALLTKIHNAQTGTRFTKSIEKAPGAQSRTSKQLTGTGN